MVTSGADFRAGSFLACQSHVLLRTRLFVRHLESRVVMAGDAREQKRDVEHLAAAKFHSGTYA